MQIRFNTQIKMWEVFLGSIIISKFPTYIEARDFKKKRNSKEN